MKRLEMTVKIRNFAYLREGPPHNIGKTKMDFSLVNKEVRSLKVRLQLRFDFDSTAVRLLMSKVIKITAT